MERWYVYVLLSQKDQRFYIGKTSNLRKRLQEHARGDVKSTRNRRPLTLIFYEYFINEEDADAREKYLKSGHGHEQLRNIFKRTIKKK